MPILSTLLRNRDLAWIWILDVISHTDLCCTTSQHSKRVKVTVRFCCLKSHNFSKCYDSLKTFCISVQVFSRKFRLKILREVAEILTSNKEVSFVPHPLCVDMVLCCKYKSLMISWVFVVIWLSLLQNKI